MTQNTLGFIKFKPQIKDKVWGGKKLRDRLHKSAGNNAGESWEISGVEGSVSVVEEGEFRGRSLRSLLEEFKEKFVGAHVYRSFGNEFPLLFKFIDASDDLSVQLHPGDALAKERHGSFGKTEMWYIVDSEPGSRLILGFNKPMDVESYQEQLKNGKLTEVLSEETVKAGDSYFISTGTVHAIGAGILLAEIQQTSDITYRIYDWDRPDVNGSYRELHTDLSLEAIDFQSRGKKLEYVDSQNKAVNLCTSDYFITNRLHLTGEVAREINTLDSFVVYMCVDGKAAFLSADDGAELQQGETLFVPACVPRIKISSDSAVLLEIYIP